jgi:hypothetical protein
MKPVAANADLFRGVELPPLYSILKPVYANVVYLQPQQAVPMSKSLTKPNVIVNVGSF